MAKTHKLMYNMLMFAAVGLVLYAAPVAAIEPLTLEQCIGMALEANLRIGIADERLSELDAAIDEAATARMPKVTGQAMYTRLIPQPENPMADLMGSLIPGSANSKLSGNIATIGINVNHALYTGGRVESAQRIAAHGRAASGWQKKSTVREVRRDVTKAYYNAIAANMSVVALDSAIALMEVLVRDMDNAVEVGMRGQHELLQAQVQLLNQRLTRQQAATGAQAAHNFLATLIGVPVNTPIILANDLSAPESFSMPSLEEMQQRARSASTDLKALEEQMKILETSVAITRAANLPTVFAAAGYTGGQAQPGEAKKFSWNNNGTITLGLQWDIYDGGAINQRIRQTQSQIRQLELSMENLLIYLDMTVKNSGASLLDAFMGIETGRENIAQTRKSYGISRDIFNEGMLLSSELLHAQNLCLQAEVSYYASLSMFYALQAELDYLLNEE